MNYDIILYITILFYIKGKSMKILSISDIQKNISIFNSLTETIQVLDKRKNKVIATIFPNQKNSVVKELGGKYAKYLNGKKKLKDFNEVRELALKEAFKEKYGLSD
jgi:hypothetical protein